MSRINPLHDDPANPVGAADVNPSASRTAPAEPADLHPRLHDAPHGERLDAAQQSLADALRTSFSLLKWVMLVLLVIYLFSGWFSVDAQHRAVRLRFGQIVNQDAPAPGSGDASGGARGRV